ncbi:putative Zn peptidase [Mycobacteroides abscessus subsp. abscessus]|uniref:helix-turn-helix domain-containing protein n=1 Tax=Mycobacteroides abscessus TaxID=36809 RepID=UPI0009CA5A37|nr:XRE family transcriptional regulator [Mycobacteroides abscessus]SKF15051.1 putative Zn peptidase [Mycobacteroides abscessus subsp. abscessus]
MSTSWFVRSASDRLDARRIEIARTRRGLTKLELGQQLGVTARTITKYEAEGAPASAATALASVLEFPEGYFTRCNAPLVEASGVSFRAARRATARQREAAAAAGVLGVEINDWVSARFMLPGLDLPDFHGDSARAVAVLLRAMWGLGTKPLPNLVQLCESRGIRVYTLPPFADAVDAYSIWYEGVPYIFLARRKTPERIRFDLAHELGHLLLHRDVQAETTAHEREADVFASEFLIPSDSIVEYLRYNPNVAELLEVKYQFKVSAMALAYATHAAGRMSDWAYRQTCIELSQRGFRCAEPAGMSNYEMSRVFPQVLSGVQGAPVSARLIATELHVPVSEVHALTFGAELRSAQNTEAAQYTPADQRRAPQSAKPQLQIV